MKVRKESNLSLIALNIEGEWNRPILENAATLSGAECIFTPSSDPLSDFASPAEDGSGSLDKIISRFPHVVASESTRDSISIYDFPTPRQKTALIVGNEEKGIPKSVLKKSDTIVSIPMAGMGMSSVNVAVAAAITLYVMSTDWARNKHGKGRLTHHDVDILVHLPPDPHEVGSLLRSAWAFGWRRIFLADPDGAWFTQDPKTMLDGRAAARRHKNPLTVIPVHKLKMSSYDRVLVCDSRMEGTALSRLQLPACRKLLIVLGDQRGVIEPPGIGTRLHVDYLNSAVVARFRHTTSIILSVISQMLSHCS